MHLLHPGQDTVLSWNAGAVECKVVAAAGEYVLLRPDTAPYPENLPCGPASLTYLEGYVPMGWDGQAEPGTAPGELRFRVGGGTAADRRGSVRVPLSAPLRVTVVDEIISAELLDISAGGARFRCRPRLAAGTQVRVYGTLPGDLVLDADAVVRASQPGIASVQFTALRGVDAAGIGAWSVGVLRSALA
jgi:hypothetical protein